MRTKRIKSETQSASYDLSISDLMAALCCIFLIFLAKTVLSLNKKVSELNTQVDEYSEKNNLAERYRLMQQRLYDDLHAEFQEKFDEWDLTLTPDLTFHFQDKDTLFTPDKSDLQPRFEDILNEFFPHLIKVISKKDYVDKILEIRIEGHTAINQGQSREEDYRTGMELSQERTREVLFYCLNHTKFLEDKIQGEDSLEWTRKHIAAIGYSNSIPYKDENGKNDWEKSRRVEIKIRTDAESVITDFQNLSGK